MIYRYECKDEDAEKSVRQVLTRAGFSTRLLKRVRHYGNVTVDGKHLRLIDHIKAGDTIVVTLPEPQDTASIRQDPDLDIVYLDDWYVGINKKAGQVVHPTITHSVGTITDRLASTPLHPVIRLDRETSGILLIARLSLAHYYAVSHPMQKIYLGIVHGRFQPTGGVLTGSIMRSEDTFMRRRIHPEGKEAKTLYQEVAISPQGSYSLVAFKLVTGRTHQIRLHCLWHGHPLLGDSMYGLTQLENIGEDQDYVRPDLLARTRELYTAARLEKDSLISRQALHAAFLNFRHPESQEYLGLQADLAADMVDLLTKLEIRVELPISLPKSLL
ncbi:MAG TPA: hypothetical protein GXZ59_03310, partial [Clostridiaceae bacterium]|nr:hypothetical protein [Clostridiaceae bacterium]